MNASISPRRFILVLAAIALLVGVIALSMPISTAGHTGFAVDCGTGWSLDLLTAQDQDTQRSVNQHYSSATGIDITAPSGVEGGSVADNCTSTATRRRAWAWPLIGLGLTGGLGALFVRRQDQSASQKPDER